MARVLLQGRDIVQTAIFAREVDKQAVIQALHACKESLVICEKAAGRVASSVDRIVEQIHGGGPRRDRRSGALNPFPQVLDPDADATAFLINAKPAIQIICRLPSLILPVPARDNNFDALAKTLARTVGSEAPLTEFVRATAPGVRYLIKLRNSQEHPNAKRTIIENFAVAPNGSILPPKWHVTGQTPQPIRDEMLAGEDFLVEVAEAMLIKVVLHGVEARPFRSRQRRRTESDTTDTLPTVGRRVEAEA